MISPITECQCCRAYKRLTRLAAARSGEAETLSGKIFQGVVHSLDTRANAPGLADKQVDVPLPPEPLPWGDDPCLPRGNVAVSDSTVKHSGDKA